MEEFNFELNLEEFMQAIEALHHSLNSDQKSILYNYKRKKPAIAWSKQTCCYLYLFLLNALIYS